MIRILCGENNLEYAGDGYFQCSKRVNCPKSSNKNHLGFDCIAYIDDLPEGYQLITPDVRIKESMNRTIEYVTA